MSTHERTDGGETAAEYLERSRREADVWTARYIARGMNARTVPTYASCAGERVICGYDTEVNTTATQEHTA